MDDSKLLQELNLTERQPRGRHIILYISFNKHCCLASEGLVNLSGSYGAQTSGPSAPHAKMLSITLCNPLLSNTLRNPLLSNTVGNPLLSNTLCNPLLSSTLRNPVLSKSLRPPQRHSPVNSHCIVLYFCYFHAWYSNLTMSVVVLIQWIHE